MVERWAMVKNGQVDNICLWDGQLSTWHPPQDVVMIKAPDYLGIGWRYENEQWLEPIFSIAEESVIVDNLSINNSNS